MQARPSRKCDECGKFAEWPQTLATARLSDESGVIIEYEYPLCEECLEQMEAERNLEAEVRRGEMCGLCYAPLELPDVTTIDLGESWFPTIPGEPRIIRVCQACDDNRRKSTHC